MIVFKFKNEKTILSTEGEEIAKKRFLSSVFDEVDMIFSSNYTRAIGTAKYLAEKKNLKIIIVDDLGERKFGITSWEEKPEDFERRQFLDENYKLGNGESQKEVRERMTAIIKRIIKECQDKKLLLVSHATAISYFLKNWCNIEVVDDKLKYSYHGKELIHGYLNNCETFKLTFDQEQLVDIELIPMDK